MSLVFKWGSHLSYGPIQRLCASVSYSQEDAKKLYKNLKAILRHFTTSPKSTELLNNALDALEKWTMYMHLIGDQLEWLVFCMHTCMHAWWWWWWGIVFVVWLTGKRRLALFPTRTIVRDPHHYEFPTCPKQDLNHSKIWIQTLLNEAVQQW